MRSPRPLARARAPRAALLTLACCLLSTSARPLLGVEFTSTPATTCDIIPLAPGGWTVASATAGAAAAAAGLRPPLAAAAAGDRPAAIDADGWPTEDAFLIVFIAAPDAVDPAQFTPAATFGDYRLSFRGRAVLQLSPQVNSSVRDVVFNATCFTTTATLTLSPPVAGLSIGFAQTQRNATAPAGSGVSHVRLLQPGAPDDCVLYTPDVVAAVGVFAHARFMTWTGGEYVLDYVNASQPGLGVEVGWADRTLPSDALWGTPGVPRPRAFGAPWESVVLLAQAARVGVWVNVPVQATDDYVTQLALLLRDGNAVTGGAGVPAGLPVYVEHANEVWLNGSAAAGGGPSAAYAYNRAAAVAELAADPGSALNVDGVGDPEVWAYRRHLRRVVQVGALFTAVFGAGSFGARVRPVLGWVATFQAELEGLGAWYTRVLAPTLGPVPDALYGVAINAYAVAGVAPGASVGDVVAAVTQASDATRGDRAATAAIVAAAGLRLLSYEGSLVAIPVLRDASTTTTIIDANRAAGWGAAMAHDFAVNWAPLPGAGEFNFFALASQYGEDAPVPRYQWGLTEDVHDTSTAKFDAVRGLLGGGDGDGVGVRGGMAAACRGLGAGCGVSAAEDQPGAQVLAGERALGAGARTEARAGEPSAVSAGAWAAQAAVNANVANPAPTPATAAARDGDPVGDARQRLLDLLCLPSPATNASALAGGADALQRALRPNGTWADVDYNDPQDRALWRTYAHLERTATMIQAATWPRSPLYAQPSLFNASRRALLAWSELDPQVSSGRRLRGGG